MVMETTIVEKPVRVAVFSTTPRADEAVTGLLSAGFTKDQITVMCSDLAREQHFSEYDHRQPAGTNAPVAAAAGGAIGSILGGLAAIASVVATGGVGILVAGPIFAATGAVAGGLVGAMMTRGVEKEAANYYDQAVTRGKILVAAEDQSDNAEQLLAQAERVFTAAGAEPIELVGG
jgi:outer membrane lipoprotein SlyB